MYKHFDQYDQKLQVKAEEMMSKIFFVMILVFIYSSSILHLVFV